MIYLALWIVPALIVCVTLSFIFGTIVGAIVLTFEKLQYSKWSRLTRGNEAGKLGQADANLRWLGRGLIKAQP